VTLVVMEATSAYWKPPFYLLEDDIECWVVNARDVKNVPGRPKLDAEPAITLMTIEAIITTSVWTFVPGFTRLGEGVRDAIIDLAGDSR
jgi:transposase